MFFTNLISPLKHRGAMQNVARRGIHYKQKLNKAAGPSSGNGVVPPEMLREGQEEVIKASLSLIRERARLKV